MSSCVVYLLANNHKMVSILKIRVILQGLEDEIRVRVPPKQALVIWRGPETPTSLPFVCLHMGSQNGLTCVLGF